MSSDAKEHIIIRDNLSNKLVLDIKQFKHTGDGGDGRRDEFGPLADQYLDRDIKPLEQKGQCGAGVEMKWGPPTDQY